ncbi:MAG TPA: TonB-dependent receptor [Pseudomonadales bacterium]
MKQRSRVVLTCVGMALVPMAAAEQAREGRRIEEVIVTAEKREATVSDTSISITAMGEMMIEDFGLQSADDLVNFVPATTRDAYDIRIRGVGRNFRALGGDPGVATYYNGVYSEDFGIAASENGLYDVARIEVLRGPQGTLYGRNSIGGALNYITNKPTYEWEGEVRALLGNFNAQEYYGIISGPLIADRLAMRVVGLTRERDGSIDGDNGSDDIETIDDQNFSVALNWRIADNWEANLRWNDRESDRVIGQALLVNQGPAGERGTINNTKYAYGLRPVPVGTPGALTFTHPITGEVRAGAPIRPGIDVAATHRPNSFFGVTGQRLDDLDDPEGFQATNPENNERFIHNAVQFDLTWDINETTSLKYIGGWMDFDYTFDIDNDWTNGTLSIYRQTVLEAVETHSHELQLLWQIGDKLQMTSGLYYFNSDRLQNYAFKDLASQGRYTRPVNYGFMAPFATFAPHQRLGDGPPFGQSIGAWEGDPEGAFYEYANTVETDAYAVYTQGTYSFNEQWALTLGIRWAQDEKSAFENRTGYFEANINDPTNFINNAPFFAGFVLEGVCTRPVAEGGFGLPSCASVGLTPLAMMNILMGAAVPTFNPANPIVPTCALDDPDCATPLRLTGLPFSFADTTEGEDEWSDVTWRVNLDWTPNDDTLVYASVTTGYRAGGYSLGIGDSRGPGVSGVVPASYDKEEIIAYEIGYKGTFFDGRLQLNSSIYHYDFDNYQDRVELFNAGSGTSVDVVQNVEEAQNRGVEIEITWLPTENWTIGGNGSYADTEYKSDFFILEDDNPLFPEPLFDDVLGDDAFLVRNLKGSPLKRIPEWKFTAWTYYDWQFSRGTLTAGATWAYTGSYFSEGIERDLDETPSRDRVDVYLTWRDNRDRWNVRAFVDNVFDDIGIRGIGTGTAASDWQQTATSLYPRFYGLDVTYRMGGN